MKYIINFFLTIFISILTLNVGAELNKLAVRTNNGQMPVIPLTKSWVDSLVPCNTNIISLDDPEHCIMDVHTNYKILCDILPFYYINLVDGRIETTSIASIGDLLLEVSDLLFYLAFLYYPFRFIYDKIKKKPRN